MGIFFCIADLGGGLPGFDEAENKYIFFLLNSRQLITGREELQNSFFSFHNLALFIPLFFSFAKDKGK